MVLNAIVFEVLQLPKKTHSKHFAGLMSQQPTTRRLMSSAEGYGLDKNSAPGGGSSDLQDSGLDAWNAASGNVNGEEARGDSRLGRTSSPLRPFGKGPLSMTSSHDADDQRLPDSAYMPPNPDPLYMDSVGSSEGKPLQ
jgi:hypothetical protein